MGDRVSERDADSATADAVGEPPLPDVSPCYEAYVERRDHRPDSCTIYSSVTLEATRDRWIKAWGDAFVSREDAR